jgi:hypothetical protein
MIVIVTMIHTGSNDDENNYEGWCVFSGQNLEKYDLEAKLTWVGFFQEFTCKTILPGDVTVFPTRIKKSYFNLLYLN